MNFSFAATSSGSSGVRGFLSFDKQYVRRILLDLSTCTPGQTSPTVFIRLFGYIPRSATWQAEVSANDQEKPFSFDVDSILSRRRAEETGNFKVLCRNFRPMLPCNFFRIQWPWCGRILILQLATRPEKPRTFHLYTRSNKANGFHSTIWEHSEISNLASGGTSQRLGETLQL